MGMMPGMGGMKIDEDAAEHGMKKPRPSSFP